MDTMYLKEKLLTQVSMNGASLADIKSVQPAIKARASAMEGNIGSRDGYVPSAGCFGTS